jgi:hypothetical protein
MYLYVFAQVLCHYASGTACIAAESHQEACEIFLENFPDTFNDLSKYKELPLSDSYTEKGVVHYQYGGS